MDEIVCIFKAYLFILVIYTPNVGLKRMTPRINGPILFRRLCQVPRPPATFFRTKSAAHLNWQWSPFRGSIATRAAGSCLIGKHWLHAFPAVLRPPGDLFTVVS